MPPISVIIPNYNHAPYLARRLESVLNQTRGDFELLFLDDASTDDSLRVFEPYSHDPRVRVIVNEHNSGGTFHQWAKGLREARGELAWLAESDDDADPRLLERLAGMLDEHPACTLACCESHYVFGDELSTSRTNDSHLPGRERWTRDYVVDGRRECADHMIRENTLPNASAVVFRREAYERVGGVDRSMRLCGDWLLWAKLMCEGDLAHVGEPLNRFRCHPTSVRGRNRASARSIREVYQIMEFIASHTDVPSATLEEALEMRAQRFLHASLEHGFSASEVWSILRAARRVDPRAWRRLGAAWLRWRAGAARRRALRAIVPGSRSGGAS